MTISSPSVLRAVAVNMANAITIENVGWPSRIDALTAAITSAGSAPDVISMAESAGLWHCPFRPNADDYVTGISGTVDTRVPAARAGDR